MYKKIGLFAAMFAVAGIANHVSAQASASATITANVLVPISITKVTDLNYGNISVSAVPGTLTIDPAGSRTATGGVSLPVVSGTVTPATFTVNGAGGSTYSITLPGAPTILTSGANTMTSNSYASVPSGTGTLLLGSQTLAEGSTLTVGASQAAGLYVSATPFTVTVNYN